MLSSSLVGFEFMPFEVSAKETLKLAGPYASKLPMDVLHLASVDTWNVHRKRVVVFLVIRDPRDILTSVHPNVPDDYFMHYDWRWSPRGNAPDYSILPDPRGFSRVDFAVRWAGEHDGYELMEIRYEDLVANSDAVQEKIQKRFGFTMSGRFSEFHLRRDQHAYAYAGDRAPTDPSRVRENSAVDPTRTAKWRRPEHRGRIIELFTKYAVLFDVLERYGYESDRSWFEPFTEP